MYARACLFIFTTFTLIASTRSAPPYPTIKQLNTDQYLGRWYNMFANAYTLGGTLEFGTKCVIADYGVVQNRDDAITVYNAGQVKLIGTKFSTNGFATQSPDPSEPGKFLVTQSAPFGTRPAPTEPPVYTASNYNIMELGPVVDGKYEYTLITGGKQDLFVLARDKDRFVEKYQKDVLEKLATWGFTGKAAPAVTSQGDCSYPPPPAIGVAPAEADASIGVAPAEADASIRVEAVQTAITTPSVSSREVPRLLVLLMIGIAHVVHLM